MSGEKSQRPPKQSAKKRIGKQTVAKTSPSTSARGNKSKKETEEQSSAFGDILGLVSFLINAHLFVNDSCTKCHVIASLG